MKKSESHKSALKVKAGINQPSSVDEKAANLFKSRKKQKLSTDDFVSGIRGGDRTILSQAITLIESALYADREMAQDIIARCLPFSGKSIRVGITGIPGVGKSTFIEALGIQLTRSGKKLAVLAIDPSSERSKGSILGDKTRMEALAADPNAFIRPSPSAGTLGGVARKTRESIILCEAAGFDTIFVETVGVGQSETAVHSMVDFFLLLMLAGAGDELQGIKRGIIEMADVIAITKADGSNLGKTGLAKVQYQNALHLFPPAESGWTPQVLTCSSNTNEGLRDIWDAVEDYISFTKKNGFFEKSRTEQSGYWMHETILESLREHFYNDPAVKQRIIEIGKSVKEKKISSFVAARKLLDEYFQNKVRSLK